MKRLERSGLWGAYGRIARIVHYLGIAHEHQCPALRAQAQGKRLVLVITGKGKNTDTGGPIPTRNGVLRHAVPQWLGMAPLSGLVLQITQAHVRHGGGGAYYVYLRRNR